MGQKGATTVNFIKVKHSPTTVSIYHVKNPNSNREETVEN